MPRKRSRTSNQGSWNQVSMEEAVQSVRQNKLSFGKAAKQYNVPVGSLFRRVHKDQSAEEVSRKKLGRYTNTFSAEQENELLVFLLEMEKRFYGLTNDEFRQLVYQFAELNKIPHRFSHEKKMAGKDFLYNFKDRHPELSLRQPESTSFARAAGFNRVVVDKFFNILEESYEQFRFKPHRIFNCDEKGISTVPNKQPKILSIKGKKQVGAISSAERGVLITVEVAMSATGIFVPPLLVFPRVRHNPLFNIGLPAGSIVVPHPSGWMQMEIFDKFIDHFIEHTKPSRDDPVLLILDGHATHTKNVNLLQKCKEKHVHMLVIPPHTSHKLQPLDVGFMFSLSMFYSQEVKCWLRNNPGKVVTLHDVSPLFGKAFLKAATPQNAVSSFKATGIWPFDRHIFKDEDFAAADVTDREQPALSQEKNLPEVPSTSCSSRPSAEPSQQASNSSSLQPSPELSQQASTSISPFDIIPLPKARPRANPQKRKGGTAMVTSSPYLKQLREEKVKAVKPIPRKRLFATKKKHTKPDSSSSDSDVEETLCQDSGDSPLDEAVTSDEESRKGFGLQNCTSYDVGDYVYIELECENKRSIKQYAAQIEKVDNNELEVKFMRNYRRHHNIFVFPPVDECASVSVANVRGKFRKHRVLRHGQLQFF